MEVRVGCLFIYTVVYFGLCIGVPRGQEGPPGPQGPIGLTGQPGIKGEKGERGEQGFPGEKGAKGVTGIPGLTGLTGSKGNKGDTGEPGRKGDPGPAGWSGLPGPKGEKGAVGPTGPLGQKGDKGECVTAVSSTAETGPMGPMGPPGPPGKDGAPGEKGQQGKPGQRGPQGLPGAKGEKGLKGQKGDRGPAGINGTQGKTGLPGEKGVQGIQGPQGPKGDTGPAGPAGLPGINGTSGEKGQKGDRGPAGINGTQGKTGPQGEKGVQGIQGPTGVPGPPGVCPTVCPNPEDTEDTILPENIKPPLGTEGNPSPMICKFRPWAESDTEVVPAPNPFWVMKKERFPVHCNETTHRTCLILPDDLEHIKDNKVFLGDVSKGTWISELGFDLNKFYKISENQLHWLKEQSRDVIQIIRVYMMNITFDNLKLHLLNALDIVIGQEPSIATPMYYHYTDIAGNHTSASVVDGKMWKYVDVTIIGNVRRLPVVDFYVENAQHKNASIALQLRELCYG